MVIPPQNECVQKWNFLLDAGRVQLRVCERDHAWPARRAGWTGLCRAHGERGTGRPQRCRQDLLGHRAGVSGGAGWHQDPECVHDGEVGLRHPARHMLLLEHLLALIAVLKATASSFTAPSRALADPQPKSSQGNRVHPISMGAWCLHLAQERAGNSSTLMN